MTQLPRLRLALFLGSVISVAVGIGMLSEPSSAKLQAASAKADPMTADDPKTWKTILTDKDVEAILSAQIEPVKEALRSNGTFLRGFRKIQYQAHVIAMVGNIQTLRGEGDDAKKGSALRDAGMALADAAKAKKFDEAKKALELIESYPKSIAAGDGKSAPWAKVFPLEPLMKNVNAVDGATNAAVRKDDKAFAKSAKELSVDTVLLACLAVVSREHNAGADWKGWCDDMRDASLTLSKELGKKNLAGSKDARNELQKSCTSCHEVYRKEE